MFVKMTEKRDILRIAQGNDFTLLVHLSHKMADNGELATADISDTATTVIVVKENGSRIHVPKTSAGMDAHALQWKIVTTDDGKAVAITFPCTSQLMGNYGLEIKGTKSDDSHWRYKAKPGEAFEIVDATSDQHIPDNQVRVFALTANVGIGAGMGSGGSTEQVQSDWEETDDTSPAYIQHKPEIPSLEGYATQQWVEEQRYLTQHQSLDGYVTQQWVENQRYLTQHQSLDGYATQQWVNQQNFLKTHQDISGKENRMQIVAQNSLTFTADTGKYYRITQSGTITVTLPSVQSNYIEGFLLFFTAASDDCISFVSQDTVNKSEGFEIKAGDVCEVNAVYNGDSWVVTVVKFS